MRIGVDIRDLSFSIVGVGNVILNMLASLKNEDKENEYILYQNSDEQFVGSQNFKKAITRIGPYQYFQEQVYFSARTYLDKLDIFHSPIHLPPVSVPHNTKVVFTVHDLHSELDEKFFPKPMNKYFQKRRIQAIKNADRVIVHSEFVKEKLLELSGVSEEKVALIPLGVSNQFQEKPSQEKLEAIRSKYNLPHNFILFVGSIEPWKRVPFLIESFLKFQEKHSDFNLVIVGRKGWRSLDSEFVEEASENHSSIHWLGYLGKEDLPHLYHLADLFCSPSLWEGFGLIFLEAMAAGLPCVGANHSAVPEIIDNAGLVFDPFSQEDLISKWESILLNGQTYSEFSKNALRRVSLFSWDNYGREVLNVYNSLNEALVYG